MCSFPFMHRALPVCALKSRGISMTYQLPPGPKPKPVVGNILEFRKGQLAFVTGLHLRTKFGMRMLLEPTKETALAV